MKKISRIVLTILFCFITVACGKSPTGDIQRTEQNDNPYISNISVGFSQVGAESDWRCANTESMKTVLSPANGYDLTYDDAQQKQTNQITALRRFIQQDVDYIVLAPVTEKGWDTVLQEVKDAGIEVIVVDRMVDVADESLFTCFVGSDFELEAKKVTEWINAYTVANGIDPSMLHIADIQGTIGSSAQIGRTKGLKKAAEKYGWDIVCEVEGEYTESKGYEAVESILKQYDDINVIYCENDNEAFGAIDAVRAAGREVGDDILNGEIMIVSFDGVSEEAILDVINGDISVIGECNPLHGPRVLAALQELNAGEQPPKLEYVDEQILSASKDVTAVFVDGTEYSVTIIDEKYLEGK